MSCMCTVYYEHTSQSAVSVCTNLSGVLSLESTDFELVEYLLHLRVRVALMTLCLGFLLGSWC